MDAYSEAVKWVSRGIAVIPIPRRYKIPRKGFLWTEFQFRLPTEEELRLWFQKPFPNNLAVVTGWNNLMVLDFDDRELFFRWWSEMNTPQTYMVLTRRGVHVYFYCDDLPRSQNFFGGNLQAKGKYAVGVPSVHPSGAIYQVITDFPIMRIGKLEEMLPEQYQNKSVNGTKMPSNSPLNMPITPLIPSKQIIDDPWLAASMPRSNTLIAEIKERMPILLFFPNVIPCNNGTYKTRCPFPQYHDHSDIHNSFFINPAQGTCRCSKGGCPGYNDGKMMDVINLVAKMQGISNLEAIERLGELCR
jgi:hypothetical protein